MVYKFKGGQGFVGDLVEKGNLAAVLNIDTELQFSAVAT